MSKRATPTIAVAFIVAAVLVTACGGTAVTREPGALPAATDPVPPSITPSDAGARDPDAIDHPTGPADVVLRVSETGGFVLMDHAMISVPLFTLYGDDHVLVVAPDAAGKGLPGTLETVPVLLETRLTEPEVQAVLQSALTDGHLGIARAQYNSAALDLPTTVFEIQAGGVTRTVSVGGLAAEPAPGPDAPVLAALAQLGPDGCVRSGLRHGTSHRHGSRSSRNGNGIPPNPQRLRGPGPTRHPPTSLSRPRLIPCRSHVG